MLFNDKYKIIKKLGSGAFGDLYCIQNSNNEFFAAKIEKHTSNKLKHEFKIYSHLHKHNITSIPLIKNYIETHDYNILIMSMLTSDFDNLFEFNNKYFPLGTILKFGIDALLILENIHNCGIIHRDIKPNNFLLDTNNKLHLIDFGLSKFYLKNNKHIEYKQNKSLVGTIKYTSINIHLGIESSRRDDLESLGYILIYFLLGSLPWQFVKKKENKYTIVKNIKIRTDISKLLCDDKYQCFIEFIRYVRDLKFDENPNYKYLSDLLTSTAIQELCDLKYVFN